MTEKILVFSKKLLDPFPGLDKSTKSLSKVFKDCLPRAYFVPRNEAEKDESLLQVIPYVVFRDGNHILTYHRTTEGGEDRLHDKYSIGIGGHVNTDDLLKGVSGPQNIIHGYKCCQELAFVGAVRREIFEELKMPEIDIVRTKPKMLIYDERDDVGRVHLGVVLFAETDAENVQAGEPEIDKVSWKNVSNLRKLGDKLEGWSQYLIPHL